ncbi:class II aldolase/adducin family protein [Catellatospora sp. TT07R-123]|uniref:class II aldolase/adducin family protein n=1 Tax=Catellatospora sp. TT07R-123 TaxID=2733863 RepID=UPI001B09C459|nr:class II aldolase/adducin family protein [Catellatospora sp. TT07R-123]GHJ42951.1 class II aldolase/adducin family protein [Catellatospora sp. TT07R-123]
MGTETTAVPPPTFTAGLRPRPAEPFTRPVCATAAQERDARRQALAVGFRIFARLGLNEMTAGHITVRDPELRDHFWLNPYGIAFSRIRVSDLLLMDPHGEIVHGRGALNPAAFAIHSQIYAARPDAVSVAHSHSVHGKALAALHGELQPITQDAAIFYERNVLVPDFTGVVLDVSEGARIAAAMGLAHTAILANHGFLTVGTSVEDAVTLFVHAERAAQVQLIAAAAGELRPIPHAVAVRTRSQEERPDVGWARFQPLRQEIVADQPDVLH